MNEDTGTSEKKSLEEAMDELADSHSEDFFDAVVAAYVLIGVLRRVCPAAPDDEFLGEIVRTFWMVGDDYHDREPMRFADTMKMSGLNLLLRADHMKIKTSSTLARQLLDSYRCDER